MAWSYYSAWLLDVEGWVNRTRLPFWNAPVKNGMCQMSEGALSIWEC